MEKEETITTLAASLTFDILVSIFQFLDTDSKGKAAQVCTSWQRAANCKSVWKASKIKLQSRQLNMQSERSIIKRGIRKVDLDIFEPRFYELLRKNHDLEYLRFTGCCVKENMLKFFKTAPNSAEILRLAKDLNPYGSNFSDALAEDIARTFPSFHKLNPHGCHYNNDSVLKTFTSGMRKLKELYLDGCFYNLRKVSNLEINNHTAEENIKHEEPLMSLQKLYLRNVTFFKEDTFAYISQKFANLVTLRVKWCSCISDGGLVHLLKLKNLKCLSFAYSVGITDEGLKLISQLTDLESLDLSCCNLVTESGFASISGLINLTNLILRNCPGVTDATLKQLNALSHLRELDLRLCSISDAGLLNLAASSLKLTKLDISLCPGISDQGLLYISKSTFASVLSNLNVSGCGLTDYGIIPTVEKFLSLKVLHLGSCHFVTDECRKQIAEKMSRRKKNFALYNNDYNFGNLLAGFEKLCSLLQPLADSIA